MTGFVHSAMLVGLALLLLMGLSCKPSSTVREVRGVVADVRASDLTRAEAIVLRLEDERELRLAVAASVRFPPGHLREHQLFAEPVAVTYVENPDGTLTATEIVD